MLNKALQSTPSHALNVTRAKKAPTASIRASKEVSVDGKAELFTIFESNNDKYILKKPIIASISKVDGEYKIEYPSLELYAFNENKNEATEEFLDEFFDLCDNILFVNDSNLGQYPKNWKKILHTLVEENGKN